LTAASTVVGLLSALAVVAPAPASSASTGPAPATSLIVVQQEQVAPTGDSGSWPTIDWRGGELVAVQYGPGLGQAQVNRYDTSTTSPSPQVTPITDSTVKDVAAAADGSYYFLEDDDLTSITHVDADGNNQRTILEVDPDRNHFGKSIALSRDGKTLYWTAFSPSTGIPGTLYTATTTPASASDWTVLAGGGRCGSPNHSVATAPVGACYGGGQVAVSGDRVALADNLYSYLDEVRLGVQSLQTIAGDGFTNGQGGDGFAGLSTTIGDPSAVAIDRVGDVFVAASNFKTDEEFVYELTTDGVVHLVAGGGGQLPTTGLAPTAANLYRVWDMTLDNSGDLYITGVSTTDGSTFHQQIIEVPGVGVPYTAPSAPTSLQAQAGDGLVQVSFDPPADDGGDPVSSYTVAAHRQGAADTSGDVVVSADSAASPVAVTGLTNGAVYDISVTATNGLGTGPAASVSVTPTQPAAELHADVTSGEAPLAVHLDAADSTAPPGAIFTFYCGDTDVPVTRASAATTADCTYYRGSPAAGWNAFVSMHDPATGRDYQDTVAVHVSPATGTVDDSAAFPAANQDADLVVASDGSMHSTDTSNCPHEVGDDTTCVYVDGAAVLLTAAPGTFVPETHVEVYHADEAALQEEVGSNVTVQGGFAVTWTSQGPGNPRLLQPLVARVEAGGVAPARRIRPHASSHSSGIDWAAILGSDLTRVISTIGDQVGTQWNRFSSWWQGAWQSMRRPNDSGTNNVLYCGSVTHNADGGTSCGQPITVQLGVPSDQVASLAGGFVIAAGGGNVIAAGGGNVIAAGGGNVIAAGGGNVIAKNASYVIAAGGGNVIAPGGGNVIAPGGGNFQARRARALAQTESSTLPGGGNVVAVGDGVMTFFLTQDPGIGLVTPADPAPPTVIATTDHAAPSGATYPYGSRVTVRLAATADGNGTVNYVDYSTSGAVDTVYTIVSGDSADVVIDQPGTTTITYSAQDSNLNDADPQTIDVTIADPAAPGAPTNVTAATNADLTSATVSWAAPADHGDADISGYDIQVADSGNFVTGTGAQPPVVHHFDSTDTTQTITDLTEGHLYLFLVRATNGQDGHYSDPADESNAGDFATMAKVPDAPTGLVATPGDGQVALSWTAPGDSGLPLNNYFVYRATATGGPYTLISACPDDCPTAPSYTDTTVTNSTTYYYVVTAENPLGASENSAEVSATPSSPQGSQTITFAAPSGVTYGQTPRDFDPGASASSGLAITYSGGSTGVCAVTEDGSKVHIGGAGECSVTASQAGDSRYAAATPVAQTFTIAKAPLTVTASNATMTAGDDLPTVTPSYTGFVYDDSAASLTTAPTCTANKAARTTSCSGAADPDYDINYVSGTLTVTPSGGGGGGAPAPTPTPTPTETSPTPTPTPTAPTTPAPLPPSVSASDFSDPVSDIAGASSGMHLHNESGHAQADLEVPAGALPDGCVVSLYRPAGDRVAIELPRGMGYVVGFAVSWQAPDGSSPDATKPLTLTIADPAIKPGETVYVMTADGLKSATPPTATTAISDGKVVITFVSDPAFVVAKRQTLVLDGVHASKHVLAIGTRAPRLISGPHRPHGGAVIRLRTSRAATIRLRFWRMVHGRLVSAGVLVVHVAKGLNRLYFDGALPTRKHRHQVRPMADGRYRVVLSAQSGGLVSEPRRINLRLRG
jgi:hypothetical protein